MAGLKEFKEKIMGDQVFAAKFASVTGSDDLVALAAKEGFNFTADDIKNNTELTDAELNGVAGGAAILAKGKFVTDKVVFADGYLVSKENW